MKRAIVIADYCNDHLTAQELRSALLGHLNGDTSTSLSFIASSSHTIHAGYLLKQLLTTEERLGDPNNLVLFVNVDTRTDAVSTAAPFIIMKHRSGAWICGPNAGNCFSLVRTEIAYLYSYPNLHEGAQFRSRDLYMRLIALLIMEQQDEMELEELHQNNIPALEEFYVGHIDPFGTLKTTIPHSYMKGKHEMGDMITITIGDQNAQTRYSEHLFAHTPGVLVIAPGSSGPQDDPWLDIGVWEQRPSEGAKHYFPSLTPGVVITL